MAAEPAYVGAVEEAGSGEVPRFLRGDRDERGVGGVCEIIVLIHHERSKINCLV